MRVRSIAIAMVVFCLALVIGPVGVASAAGESGDLQAGEAAAATAKANTHADGWEKKGSTWRYWENGKVKTGMFKVKGKQYWANSKGKVFRNGYKKIGKKYYKASKKGVLTKDKVTTRMVKKAQKYSSRSKYLLMVDIDNPRLVVFKGYKKHWKVKYIWKCCTGKPATPTVTGVFALGAKGYSFGEDHGYSCYYWSQITGGYLFHTRKYYPHTHKMMDGRIGKRVSMGCVRLYDSSAKWIQKYVPSGTTVVCMK